MENALSVKVLPAFLSVGSIAYEFSKGRLPKKDLPLGIGSVVVTPEFVSSMYPWGMVRVYPHIGMEEVFAKVFDEPIGEEGGTALPTASFEKDEVDALLSSFRSKKDRFGLELEVVFTDPPKCLFYGEEITVLNQDEKEVYHPRDVLAIFKSLLDFYRKNLGKSVLGEYVHFPEELGFVYKISAALLADSVHMAHISSEENASLFFFTVEQGKNVSMKYSVVGLIKQLEESKEERFFPYWKIVADKKSQKK